ncbi:MAG TPA: TolC family protein, partial [Rhizomicrobium sp.]|nr:TolC family protein [Rhizomicrobium sp.]
SRLFTSDSFSYGAGPAIHLPIFDAGRIRANYAGATADLDAAVEAYNGAVLDAVRQTADAMTQVASLQSQCADQQAALDSATRSFSQAQTRYRTGLSDQIVMLNAESTLLTAREQMATLLANSTIQRVTLLLSVGGGFNPINEAGEPAKSGAASQIDGKTASAKD